MARNLDMTKLLHVADRREFSHYSQMSDAAKKEFIYSIMLRWAAAVRGSEHDAYLMRFNERVNQYGDLMWKHPDLAYAMLASCGRGRALQHEYSKAPKKEAGDTILLDFLAIHWPGLNQDEADIVMGQMDKAAFTQLVRESGLDPEQEKKITTAYGKRDSKN